MLTAGLDGYGSQVYHSGLSVSDALYGGFQRFIEWVDYVEVRFTTQTISRYMFLHTNSA